MYCVLNTGSPLSEVPRYEAKSGPTLKYHRTVLIVNCKFFLHLQLIDLQT